MIDDRVYDRRRGKWEIRSREDAVFVVVVLLSIGFAVGFVCGRFL